MGMKSYPPLLSFCNKWNNILHGMISLEKVNTLNKVRRYREHTTYDHTKNTRYSLNPEPVSWGISHEHRSFIYSRSQNTSPLCQKREKRNNHTTDEHVKTYGFHMVDTNDKVRQNVSFIGSCESGFVDFFSRQIRFSSSSFLVILVDNILF